MLRGYQKMPNSTKEAKARPAAGGALNRWKRWFSVKDHRYSAARLALVAALVLFALSALRQDRARSLDFAAVSARMAAETAGQDVSALDANGFQSRLGIAPEGVGDWLYYASDAVMDVTELLAARGEPAQLDRLQAAVEDHLAAQLEGFRNYGPEQVALLERAILWQRGGCLFFAVSERADQWERVFLSCLR